MINEWPCEHIVLKNGSFHFMPETRGWTVACEDWNFCPLCGAKRPEPKQSVLEEKFHLIFKKHGYIEIRATGWSKVVIKDLAKIAIEAVEEVIDGTILPPLDDFHETFKKEIREKLL